MRQRPAASVASALSDCLLMNLGDHARHLRDAEHVEDQRHLAVAHDGGAGKAGESLELLAQRLDDDLFGVVDLVHDQPELPVVGLQHDDVDCSASSLVSANAGCSFSSRLR